MVIVSVYGDRFFIEADEHTTDDEPFFSRKTHNVAYAKRAHVLLSLLAMKIVQSLGDCMMQVEQFASAQGIDQLLDVPGFSGRFSAGFWIT